MKWIVKVALIVSCVRFSLQAEASEFLRLDDQQAGSPLLPVAESVIDEGKLTHQVGGKFKHHAASCRDAEGLYPVHRAFRRRAQINGLKLLTDNVKIARMRRPRGYHIEAYTIAPFYPDRRMRDIAPGAR